MSLVFKCSVLMLVSSVKLPGFVAVIQCKEEFLILGVFFPCVVRPFIFLLLAVNTSLPGDGLSRFSFLAACPLSSLCITPLFEPRVLWPHQALPSADALQDCCCLKQSLFIAPFHCILMYR